jgi:hypothetical protein
MHTGFLAATLLNRMQFFEQKKGPRLNRYKSSMMRRVTKTIMTMRGEEKGKSILESLRADEAEVRAAQEEEEGENGGYGLALSKRTKGLKV